MYFKKPTTYWRYLRTYKYPNDPCQQPSLCLLGGYNTCENWWKLAQTENTEMHNWGCGWHPPGLQKFWCLFFFHLPRASSHSTSLSLTPFLASPSPSKGKEGRSSGCPSFHSFIPPWEMWTSCQWVVGKVVVCAKSQCEGWVRCSHRIRRKMWTEVSHFSPFFCVSNTWWSA